VDEACLLKVGGGGLITTGVSFGFSAYRPAECAAIVGGLSFHDHLLYVTTDPNPTTHYPPQTLAISGNTATITGQCVQKIIPGSFSPCTYTLTVEDGTPDRFTLTIMSPTMTWGPADLPANAIAIYP